MIPVRIGKQGEKEPRSEKSRNAVSEKGMHKLELDSRLQKTDLEILNDLEALQRDPATAELIRTGRTMGCFYIESPSMRSLFQRMHCECYEDVVAASSIIRPGVAESGMMKAYVERFREARGEKKDSSRFQVSSFRKGSLSAFPNSARSTQHTKLSSLVVHPKLAEVLSETFGVMVYQEDVLKVVHEMAGLSLGEADILRRAMSGKAGAREAMESITERFFAGCRARGVPEPVVVELWRQIETFARFSFCKGHSAAFAVLSYQVAYLKAHHPAEFLAAVLANGGGYYGAAAYVQECRRMGLRVLGPDVNDSEVDYVGRSEARGKRQENYGLRIADLSAVALAKGDCGFSSKRQEARGENPKLEPPNPEPHPPCPIPYTPYPKPEVGFVRVGFAAIKNFPHDLARRIVRLRRGRAFDSFEDFLRRVRPGCEAAEKLIRVGAFDGFGIPRARLFLELDVYYRKHTTDDDMSDLGLQSEIQNPKSEIGTPQSPLVQHVADEIELLGYGVSAHPLELLPDTTWRGTIAAREMRRYVGRRVTMIGWLIAAKLLRTHKTREFMKFLSLEDLTDTFEVTLFPRAYSRFAPLTLSPGPFRIRGKIEDEQGAVSLVADHVWHLRKASGAGWQPAK